MTPCLGFIKLPDHLTELRETFFVPYFCYKEGQSSESDAQGKVWRKDAELLCSL